ncbi:MAG TPA: arsinothricin resistance N-acetyltransferase ArsN1 family B [Methylomirabilota bacterium]|nr:arsinothricin resistance N-acetyltransferase ArsN1 family B [Methylomirabilota bacterium]
MSATIRLATDADAAAVAAIYAPFCVSTAVSFETTAPSAPEMANRIRALVGRLPWLVLDADGLVAGYVYASPHRERAAYGWSVDAAVYVAPSHRRYGVGRALYTTLFQVLRLQGYYKAYAGITLPNPASVGLHEAIGFELVGVYHGVGYKLGAWHDVAWYGLALQPERLDPGLPLPVSSILGSPRWLEAVARGLAHYRSPVL